LILHSLIEHDTFNIYWDNQESESWSSIRVDLFRSHVKIFTAQSLGSRTTRFKIKTDRGEATTGIPTRSGGRGLNALIKSRWPREDWSWKGLELASNRILL